MSHKLANSCDAILAPCTANFCKMVMADDLATK